MTGAEQLASLPPATCITYRAQTKEFEVVPESAITPDMNYPGGPDTPPSAITMPEGLAVYRSLKPQLHAQIYDEMSHLYSALGPGRHTAAAAKETLDWNWRKISSCAARACKILPPNLVYSENPPDRYDKFVSFGNLVITAALSDISPEEKRRRNEYFHAKIALPIESLESLTPAEKELCEHRDATLEADTGKRQLLAYHHVLLNVGDEIYYLPLENPEQILLMRFIRSAKQAQATSSQPGSMYRTMTFNALRNHVWATMSLAERKLVTNDPFVLYGDGPHALNGPLRHVWHNISGRMVAGSMLVEPNYQQVRFKNVPVTAKYQKLAPSPPYQSFATLRIPPYMKPA